MMSLAKPTASNQSLEVSRPRSIRFWRRLFQLGVALAFIVIPLLNWKEINFLSGNFLSFNLGGLAVIDPLAALQVGLGSLSLTYEISLGAGLILLLALLLGPVFCSWICPYGLLSEVLHGLRIFGRGGVTSQYSLPVSAKPLMAKSAITLLGLLAVLFFAPFPLLNQISMPGWYSRLFQHLVMYGQVLWLGLLLIFAVLAIEKILGQRFWCRWLCPQSLLLNLFGMLLPARFQVRFNRRRCTCQAKDRPCGKVCSLNLDPRSPAKAQRLQCSNCGDCVDACKERGQALSMGFGKSKD